MRAVVYRPAAEIELETAHRWHDERESGLGSEFIRCIEACIELIRRYPEIFPVVHREVRQGIVRRFPYSIFYLPTKDKIIILSVFHSSREPMKWRRTDSSP